MENCKNCLERCCTDSGFCDSECERIYISESAPIEELLDSIQGTISKQLDDEEERDVLRERIVKFFKKNDISIKILEDLKKDEPDMVEKLEEEMEERESTPREKLEEKLNGIMYKGWKPRGEDMVATDRIVCCEKKIDIWMYNGFERHTTSYSYNDLIFGDSGLLEYLCDTDTLVKMHLIQLAQRDTEHRIKYLLDIL